MSESAESEPHDRPVIGILHGYLLEGSGSNLWTRSIVRALCRAGQTVHLFCQDPSPESYDFVAEAWRYDDADAELLFTRETGYAGRCIVHRPDIGDVLPVFVWDEYEDFEEVVPMVELPDTKLEEYVRWNADVVESIVLEQGIDVLHANHAVMMPVVAQVVSVATGIPYAVMPHGSAIEYAVKKDDRFLRWASSAFRHAGRIFVIGDEMRKRVDLVFGERVPAVEDKLVDLNLGVDTSQFRLLPRARRGASIGRIAEQIAHLERGKTPGQSAELVAHLHRDMSRADLHELIARTGAYAGKAPDAYVEDRLLRIDWPNENVLLFVGRLIAAKGPQAVIAALPLILEQRPDTRLVIVGHGPLREALEAFVWALRHREPKLARNIARWGRGLEDAGEGATVDEAVVEPLIEVDGLFERLEREGRLEAYFDAAERFIGPETVIFTGYLTHDELRHLFPSCDAAVFPSVVPEAGPLVFLEALASGCFPLGTDFAGMAASIANIAEALPPGEAEWMKLDPDPREVAHSIAVKVPGALERAGRHRDALRQVAVERYDWRAVAERLVTVLADVADEATGGRRGAT